MEISEANFLYVITGIRQKLFRFLEAELAKEGIRGIAPSFGDILFVLDSRGTITMQELARCTMKDKSTISSVVGRLEAGGYITREKDGADARFTRLTLTGKARKLRTVLFGISEKMRARMFAGVSPEEKDVLFELLGKVYRNV